MPATIPLDVLNSLSESEFIAILKQCSSSEKWLKGMIAERPFASLAEMLAAAEKAWQSLEVNDYLEVIASHPRIGANKSEQSAFSKQEQASLALTDSLTQELARYNELYFEKFGFIFLIFASGKTASEILFTMKCRFKNSKAAEIKIAAQELMRIQELRLRKLIS